MNKKIILFFILTLIVAGCGKKVSQVKEDFVGYSGLIPQEAEMNFSKARILWTIERGVSSVESDICSDPKEAIKLLNKALAIEPKYPQALLRRAMAKSDVKDFSNALNDATKAVRLEPSSQSYAVRGLIYLRASNIQAAQKDLNYSLELNDVQYQAWNYMGVIALIEGNTREACTRLSKACTNGDCSRYNLLKKEKDCQ